MHTQKQIPCANAQQSTPTPTIYGKEYHSATIHAQLNSKSSTGIAGLLDNVALLAIANTYGCKIDKSSVSYLQSYIQTASVTLSETLTALSFALRDVLNDTVTKAEVESHITPYLVADFAALVGELLPAFNTLSENLNSSQSPNN